MSAKTWGVRSSILRDWYIAVVESILTYGATIWLPLLNCHGKRHLISAQRPYLLKITRAYANTSNDALFILSGIPPITLRSKKLANQSKFLQLNQDLPDHHHCNYTPTSFPNAIHPAHEDFHFTKLDSICPNIQFHIYTDGSKIQDHVGCAFIVFDSCISLSQPCFTWKCRLSSHNSSFQAEAIAIREAISWAQRNVLTSVQIITDSLSTIQALQKFPIKNYLIHQLNLLLLQSIPQIYFTWTKAHADNLANNLVDQIAKDAAVDPTSSLISFGHPISFLKFSLKCSMKSEWQDSWDISPNGRDLYPFCPNVDLSLRTKSRLLTQFYSGHGPFPESLFRHGRIDSPECICGSLGTPIHFAMYCPLTTEFHVHPPSSPPPQDWLSTWINNSAINSKLSRLMDFLITNEEYLRAIT